MKKIYCIIIAFAAALAVSCEKDRLVEINGTDIWEAVFESDGADTRTSIDSGTGAVTWNVGDIINFLNGSTEVMRGEVIAMEDSGRKAIIRTTRLSEGEPLGAFYSGSAECSPSVVQDDDCIDISFKIPAVQSGSASDASICAAYIETGSKSLTFKSMTNVFEFMVSNPAVRKVKVEWGESGTEGADATVCLGPSGNIYGYEIETSSLESSLSIDIDSPGKYYMAFPVSDFEADALNLYYLGEGDAEITHVVYPKEINDINKLYHWGDLEARTNNTSVLQGEFSIADGYTVRFSRGNLRAKKTDGTWTWGFYEHQYDYNSLNSNCINGKRTPSSTDDEIDLFTWGYGYWSTDPTAMEYLTDYTADKEPFSSSEDWGAAIDDKGTWRTLSADEWKYLINEDGSNTIRKDKVKTGVTVCDHTNCIILVPDVCLNSYSFDSSKTSYSSEEWAVAEAAGLVCLPAAGMSSWDYTINGVGKNCNYWTSSSSFISSDHTGESSYCAQASENGKFTCNKGGYRPLHYAVRLVTGAPAPPPAIVAVESVSIDRAELALIPGDAAKLYATVLPENATDKSVTWTSSNTSVAEVDPDSDGNATIYCYNVGTTIITVTTIDGSKTATCTVTVEAEKGPVLPGEFSVGEGHTVRFSKGNLKAVCEIPEYRWCFANNQYDYIGDAPGNTTIGNQNVWDVVDLFGWSTVANNFGINLSLDENDYSGDFVDWGKNIHDENKWRTLNKDEWEYLFSTTSRMINGKPCYSNAVNGVTIGSKIYKGVFLYPDNYNGVVVSDNSMTWDQINAAGIVFLPSTGYRYSSTVYEIGMYCFYWTSSAYDNENAYTMYSNKKNIDSHVGEGRCSGFAVRLVTDATIPPPPPSLPEGALAGEFSVGADHTVRFSKGNLFWDGDSFEFENDQNYYPASWNESHIGHFYWSKNASVARARTYNDSGTSSSNILFTNATETTPNSSFTAAGETGKYRVLSKEEWSYLFNSRTVNGGKGEGKSYSLGITYGSTMGTVIYPDNYKGDVLSGTINSLPDGVVFLSAAGYRYEMDIDNEYGCYWASDASDSDLSYEVFFDSSYIYPDSDDNRSNGAAVRLVTDIK